MLNDTMVTQTRNQFCQKLKQKDTTAKLHALKTTFAVDTSGSTSGRILEIEKLSLSMMQEFLACDKLISWNTTAQVVHGANMYSLRAMGGTVPAKIVPLLGNDCQLLVLYTDGQIMSRDMATFSGAMSSIPNKFPIIIVFTLAPSLCHEGTTVRQIERQVNMSIPESCIAFSEDVLIMINSEGSHRTIMSKGIFSSFGQPCLDDSTLVEDLPSCNLHDLKMLRPQVELPTGFLRLPGWKDPISLEAVYRANVRDEETVKHLLPVLEKLCQRVYLPNLDMDRMHALLASLSRKLNENPKLRKIQDELAQIAVSDLAGTDQHRILIQKLHAIRAAKSVPEAVARNSMINRFLSMIAEYRAGSASFVLGSNRATGAAVIKEDAFENRGQCLDIECPIMLTSEDACLLVTAPSKDDLEVTLTTASTQDLNSKDLEFLVTTDLAMEAPFWCGWALRSCVTPNLFGYEFAESAARHPYTNQEVIGYIPLSHDPAVVMRFMSRIFGHSKQLWHMVRAYIAMIAYNLDHEWCDPRLQDHLQILFDNYSATIDLRGGTTKVPLRQAFQNCLTNYATCLRNRFPQDIRAILHISKHILPDHSFDKTKITGMIEVLEKFNALLRAHKARKSMMLHVVNLDDWGHFESQLSDLQALIGYVFWKQDCEGKNDYRNLKLQIAIDTILSRDPLGPELLKAFQGELFSIPPVALPEPEGVHFKIPPKHESWTREGRPKDFCVYCGYRFREVTASDGKTYSDRPQHLRRAFGQHFFNGQEKVLEAIQELSHKASVKDIFRLAKAKLYRQYGEMAGFLHTRRCKQILIWMINRTVEKC